MRTDLVLPFHLLNDFHVLAAQGAHVVLNLAHFGLGNSERDKDFAIRLELLLVRRHLPCRWPGRRKHLHLRVTALRRRAKLCVWTCGGLRVLCVWALNVRRARATHLGGWQC
jgi:hypothetical protein